MRLRVLATLLLLAGCGAGLGPSTMEFVEITPTQPRIGEIVTVRFRLYDERGLPLAGQQVDFKLQSGGNPAVTLSPTSAQSQRGSGFAEVQLQASNRVNSVIVVATAGNKTVLSPPITFAGSTPNHAQFTFQCGQIAGDASGGRHAIGAYDPSRALIAGVKLECSAHVGDRNGDGIPNALVSFLTEAGTIGPTETSQSNVVGDATILYKSSYPLPKDVDPENWTWTPPIGELQTGEYLVPLWMEPFAWVSNPALNPPPAPGMNPREPSRLEQLGSPFPRKNKDGTTIRMNPRDNLVTMIAVTAGEEAFTDSNNNGVQDDNEPYVDLTEPFVATLADKRLAVRHPLPEDRRRSLVAATEAGHALYAELFPQLADINRNIMAALDEHEQLEFEAYLGKLTDRARRLHTEGAGVDARADRRLGGSRRP